MSGTCIQALGMPLPPAHNPRDSQHANVKARRLVAHVHLELALGARWAPRARALGAWAPHRLHPQQQGSSRRHELLLLLLPKPGMRVQVQHAVWH